LPSPIFLEIYAIAVIFVARGHGLKAVINPIKNAAIKGKLFIDIASIKDIRVISFTA
jgi:hypothetical protein